MKTIVFAVVALLATANAWPQPIRNSDSEDSSFLREVINEVVYYISEAFKQNGLDPYVAKKKEYTFIGDRFLASGRYDNFVFSGLSDIRVNSVSLSGSDINVYITLPRIAANFDNFVGDLTIGNRNLRSEFSGSVALVDLRLDAHVSLEFSDNVLDDLNISWHVGKIEVSFFSFLLVYYYCAEIITMIMCCCKNIFILRQKQEKSFNMKIIGFALVALLATANSLPQQVQTADLKDSRFVDQIVAGFIESIIELIKERGLDPYFVEVAEGEYSLGSFFLASGRVDNFLFSGLSNIVVNSVNFSGSELDIDLTLPRIAASVGNVVGDVTIGSRNIQGEFSGRVAIVDLRLVARISLGLSTYLLDDLSLSCQLGGIEADFSSFILQDRDVTDSVNNFVGNTLPTLLIQYEEQINRFFERLIIRIAERFF
ncbi:PREDICTED: uncharacterized protein LOC106111016 [Papilio polytes]|uniref:uncharacterized protein LOC106111016 n=1 Tax=Papilio polytes TaxID=76194 RepID=UPI000675E3C1|nr:PREDICTED: uncharacterized protein LOC106111016 [Papilio polytes]